MHGFGSIGSLGGNQKIVYLLARRSSELSLRVDGYPFEIISGNHEEPLSGARSLWTGGPKSFVDTRGIDDALDNIAFQQRIAVHFIGGLLTEVVTSGQNCALDADEDLIHNAALYNLREQKKAPLRKVCNMTEDFRPAEAFPPGEYLRDELEARGWTQSQFARILGRPLQLVNGIINGRKRITERTAMEVGAALGTGARVWLNLENTYRLWKAKAPDSGIARRARRASAA